MDLEITLFVRVLGKAFGADFKDEGVGHRVREKLPAVTCQNFVKAEELAITVQNVAFIHLFVTMECPLSH